ncbi:hypothetical protein [uncultured Fibrobacter sp.]|uniref:hypothetical protein n=1 Tax=uncultured Fibrobacter sp. TaxID=261512 RepID=UPI0025FBC92F|nr:hypothetical protein [uncultured Fibrobacter sp.]
MSELKAVHAFDVYEAYTKMGDLIKIIKFMEKKQNIMVKMLIHFGFRADLQDDFIRGCLKELENL